MTPPVLEAPADVSPLARTEELFGVWAMVTRGAINACRLGDDDALAETLEARETISHELDEMCAAVRRVIDGDPTVVIPSRLRDVMDEAKMLDAEVAIAGKARLAALGAELERHQRGQAAVHAYVPERSAGQQLDCRR